MTRKYPFQNKVVVITGATAGLGRAIALGFAQAGARLGLIGRDGAALADMAAELESLGTEVQTQAIDVSDADAVSAAADAFAKRFGLLDIWVNDAMVTVFSPAASLSPAEFRRVTEVTYLGMVHGCMAALKKLKPNGQIINIGSALAYRGIPLQSAYCGAKHAIRGFTASLRTELEHDKSGISISIVEMPAMNTPQFDWGRTHMDRQPKPMGTIYQPEAAARAVLKAARCRAREYWVGDSTFWTIVGNMIAPWYLDRFLARTAVNGQQTDQPVGAHRRDNLFSPVTDLHALHGAFGQEAKDKALILPGDGTRVAVVAGGALAFFLLGIAAKAACHPIRRRN